MSKPPLEILVVDDEPDVAGILVRILTGCGHHAQTAGDGRKAIALLQERKFDMVFSDWRMPEMTGADLYREIERQWPHLTSRFLLVTGDAFGDDFVRFLKDTGCRCLNKPFRSAQVRELLKELLGDDA